MTDRIKALLGRPYVRAEAPSFLEDIAAVARKLGGLIPEPLVELWQVADGLDLNCVEARLLGPTEILCLIENQAWHYEMAGPGWCPLLDDCESNYIGVCVAGPLAPRVVGCWHDPDRRVLYRGLSGFLDAVLASLDQAQPLQKDDCEPARWFFHETQGDYESNAPRTPEDHAAARILMSATSDDARSDWPTNARLLAAQLLDASNLAEWAVLLETEHFVRRDVVARMKTLDNPAIRQLLERDRQQFEDFARAVEQAAWERGVSVGGRKGHSLEIDGHWMNLDMCFYRRQIPDAFPRLMAWFADLRDGRNPHDRAGHFMADP